MVVRHSQERSYFSGSWYINTEGSQIRGKKCHACHKPVRFHVNVLDNAGRRSRKENQLILWNRMHYQASLLTEDSSSNSSHSSSEVMVTVAAAAVVGWTSNRRQNNQKLALLEN